MKNKHGANIFEISRDYGFDIEDIVDFSSNINPLGPSETAKQYLIDHMELISSYPDTDYVNLKKEIADYINLDMDDLLLFNGTTEGLINYIKLINPMNSLILSPCYSEYENELNKISSKIFYYNLLEENNFEIDLDKLISIINRFNIELFIFANPNNPTGTILDKDQIEKLLTNTRCKILIDETYIEFTDQEKFSASSLCKKYENLIVLRGLSKFFAMPGIRLGYSINSSKNLKDMISNKQMLWNINILAAILAEKSFADKEYRKSVFDFISEQRQEIFSRLDKIKDIKYYKSYGNFILCKILNDKKSKDLRDYLLTKAMVIRDCSNFNNLDEKYFRFCILNDKENKKLLDHIEEYFN